MMLKVMIEDTVSGMFWTDLDEMMEELNELFDEYDIPAEVICGNNEYISVEGKDEEEGTGYTLYLGHANRTIWVEEVR